MLFKMPKKQFSKYFGYICNKICCRELLKSPNLVTLVVDDSALLFQRRSLNEIWSLYYSNEFGISDAAMYDAQKPAKFKFKLKARVASQFSNQKPKNHLFERCSFGKEKWAISRPLFRLFLVFSNKKTIQFLQQLNVENVHPLSGAWI